MSPDARRRPINGVIAAAGIDLSHSIHGEAVLDSAQPKKSHSVFPRRKKHPSRTEKPRWATVLSTLAKNIFLLAVLWIGQWIWRWTDGGFPPFPPLDYEGRISEVESSLKKTTKALQLQLEVVDVKIRLEVDALKAPLPWRMTSATSAASKSKKPFSATSRAATTRTATGPSPRPSRRSRCCMPRKRICESDEAVGIDRASCADIV